MRNKRLIFIMLVFLISICVVPFGNTAGSYNYNINITAPYNINVTAPKSGKIFRIGNNIIAWDPPDEISRVKIDLYKGVNIRLCIDMFTNNTGEYVWYINRTDKFTYGCDYSIRISAIAEPSIYGYSSQFCIDMSGVSKDPVDIFISLIVIGIIVISIVVGLIIYYIKTHKMVRWIERLKIKIRKRKNIKKYKKARKNKKH